MTDPWTDRLSDYLEDDLTPEERRAVEAHCETCAACRGLVADLRAVRRAARALPDVAPGTDLWAGIARRIGEAPAPRRRVPLVRRRVVLSLPQLAAAATVLLLLGGGVVWQVRPDAPPAAPVASVIDTPVGGDQLDPRTARVLEESLHIIDRAILRAEAALTRDPDDAYLRQHVAETRQRKRDLLRQAAALTVS